VIQTFKFSKEIPAAASDLSVSSNVLLVAAALRGAA